MLIEINNLEKDIIREIVNIGLAKAGDSLAKISGDQVLLTVPSVDIIETDKIIDLLAEATNADVIIHSDLRGELTGKCILLFNKVQINKLCDVCLKGISKLTNPEEMQISLVLEISNILTGAIVTQLANIFKLELHGSPPDYVTGDEFIPFIKKVNASSSMRPIVFIIKTYFINNGKTMDLPLLLIFDLISLKKMLTITRDRLVPGNQFLKPAV